MPACVTLYPKYAQAPDAANAGAQEAVLERVQGALVAAETAAEAAAIAEQVRG